MGPFVIVVCYTVSMTLTPETQKMREYYETLGIYAQWRPDGSVSLNDQQVGILAVWTHGQLRHTIDEVAGMFAADRKRIQDLETTVSDLEDKVYDLMGMVYNGESPGV